MAGLDGYKDLSRLTWWVKALLYVQIALSLVAIGSSYMEYNLLTDYEAGVYTSQTEAIAAGDANDRRQQLVGIAELVAFVVAGVVILMWIHRANKNARALGATGMRFTSGWAVGWYFVPFAAIWMPYQAMREIWKTSQRPSDWEGAPVSSLLPTWWLLWLVSNVLGQVAFRMLSNAEELSDFFAVNALYQASSVVSIALAVVFINVASSVERFQKESFTDVKERLRTPPEGEPPAVPADA